MCPTLGWTLRTYLYGGCSATSGNGVRLNRKLLTTSCDSALESALSRVMTYRPMTMAAETSKVARRRTDPGGRFILQVPHSIPTGFELGGAGCRQAGYLPDASAFEKWFKNRISLTHARSRHKQKDG